jgi:hypothetical protein
VADNIVIDAGAGGATVASDDVGGIHYQWVKIAYGGDDVATKVAAGAPFPVLIAAVSGGIAFTVTATDLSVKVSAVSTGVTIPVSLSGDQAVKISAISAGLTLPVSIASDAPVKVSAVSGGLVFGANLSQVGGNAVTAGAGNVDTGTQRVVIASDQADVAVKISGVSTGVTLPVSISGDQAVKISAISAGLTLPVSIASDAPVKVSALTAGLLFAARSFLQTDALYSGTTKLAITHTAVSASTDGWNILVVSAGAGVKLRVLGIFLMADEPVNAYLAGSATKITGKVKLANSGTGFVLPFSPVGWGQTANAQALRLNLSSGVHVGGVVITTEI